MLAVSRCSWLFERLAIPETFIDFYLFLLFAVFFFTTFLFWLWMMRYDGEINFWSRTSATSTLIYFLLLLLNFEVGLQLLKLEWDMFDFCFLSKVLVDSVLCKPATLSFRFLNPVYKLGELVSFVSKFILSDFSIISSGIYPWGNSIVCTRTSFFFCEFFMSTSMI